VSGDAVKPEGGDGTQDGRDDNAILDTVEEALRDFGFEELADRIATGDITSVEQIKGAALRDLRAADAVLAGQVEDRKNEIAEAKEQEEQAEAQARIEAERVEDERVEAERQRKEEAGELTYADEHPVEYQPLPTKSADRTAFDQTLAEFGKHTPAWKADHWEQATPEERGAIAVGYGEPLHADLKGFTPADGELTPLERQQLEAQVKAFKAARHFVDAPTLDLVTEAERQRERGATRAELDAGLQNLAHLAKGVEADARGRLPFQTPYDTTAYPGGRPDKTVYARTADGGAIITEFDEGTGQQRVTEFSAEEYAEIKAQLMLEAPQEMPPPLSGSTLVDEMSRPVRDWTESPGETTSVQVSPFAKNEGPSTPEAFLEAFGKITRADLRLWPADTQSRFTRDYLDASRALFRGEEITEL
jgi:hypothetical protein